MAALATGEVEMDVTVGDGAQRGDLTGANGVLYLTSSDGFLYALDASTGEELLAIELGLPMSHPAVANGRVFVGVRSDVRAFALPER